MAENLKIFVSFHPNDEAAAHSALSQIRAAGFDQFASPAKHPGTDIEGLTAALEAFVPDTPQYTPIYPKPKEFKYCFPTLHKPPPGSHAGGGLCVSYYRTIQYSLSNIHSPPFNTLILLRFA